MTNDDVAIVGIELSGIRRGDYLRAIAGLRRMLADAAWVLPKHWVMHHAPECGQIQVVPFEMHGAMVHAGGFTLCPALNASGPALGQETGPGAFADGGPPLKDKDVRRLERDFGCPLPSGYRAFLLRSNGGRPERQALVRQGGDAGDIVDRFFALEKAGADTLLGAFDIYAPRVPKGLLPIARDPFGNLVLLGLAGPNLGKVFFWDHEIEPIDSQSEFANVALVAATFGQFLDGLRGLAP